MKPPKFKVVTSAPAGKNHDPSVHSDLDEAGLSVYEFAVLAHSAYCARRKHGNITTSHATVAEACRMSVSKVRRTRETLTSCKRFLTLTGTGQGVTNTYVLDENMKWGVSGSKLWLPEELWTLGLSPYELRQYCYYVCQARGTGRVVVDRDEIAQRCGITAPKQRTTDAGLIAAGLITLTGYDDRRPVLELRPNTEWIKFADRETATYTKAKRNHRTGLENKQKETTGQGTKGKRNHRTGKKKPQDTESNPVIKKPFNEEKKVEVKKLKAETAETLFEELLGKNAIAGFQHYLRSQGVGVDPATKMKGWLEQFGAQTIRDAWTIIQQTETTVDASRYGKNIRLANFCRGQLHGINDPYALCALHTRVTAKLQFVNAAPAERRETPTVDPSAFFVPRAERNRAHREAA